MIDEGRPSPEQPVAGLEVSGAGVGGDLVGESGSRGRLVPAARLHELEQIVAHELLVEVVLLAARLVSVGRPIA